MDLINGSWIIIIGFIGQSLFGARMIVQWISSEKEGKVISPVLYWQLSLVGSSVVLAYGILRADIIIVLGQFLSYYIYIRNLQLKKNWNTMSLPVRVVLLFIPAIILFAFFFIAEGSLSLVVNSTDFHEPVVLLGAVGQMTLNFRFIYQWYYSEKRKLSILPLGFWVISLAASILIFVYGIYRSDPVLLVSQTMGSVAYIRNIIIYLKRPVGHDAGSN